MSSATRSHRTPSPEKSDDMVAAMAAIQQPLEIIISSDEQLKSPAEHLIGGDSPWIRIMELDPYRRWTTCRGCRRNPDGCRDLLLQVRVQLFIYFCLWDAHVQHFECLDSLKAPCLIIESVWPQRSEFAAASVGFHRCYIYLKGRRQKKRKAKKRREEKGRLIASWRNVEQKVISFIYQIIYAFIYSWLERPVTVLWN